MIDLISRKTALELIQTKETPCISFYLPTHRAGNEIEQDPIRLKNLVRRTEKALDENGMRSKQIAEMLEPAYALIDDHEFWQHQHDGLAVFVAPDSFSTYRLPIRFEETAIVAERFYIKPLAPILDGDRHFYILALSQNKVRLFDATHYTIHEIEIEDMPKSLDEAMKYELPEKQLQFRTQAPPQSGQRAAQFHGHGVGSDDSKDEILRFFQQIDRGLQKILKNEKCPLVLAAVDYLHAIFKEANSYPHLLDQGIEGNPDHWRSEDLHEKAWPVVAPIFEKDLADALAQYPVQENQGLASNSIEEVVLAANEGRIDTLFVQPAAHVWGEIDSASYRVELHKTPQSSDTELVDFAVAQTLLHDGAIHAVEQNGLPGQSPVAAIFRYKLQGS